MFEVSSKRVPLQPPEVPSVITATTLRTYTVRDLAQKAKHHGIQGWHSMRKAELVQALVRAERNAQARSKRAAAAKSKVSRNGVAKNGKTKNGVARNGTACNGVSKNGVANRKNGVAKTSTKTTKTTARQTSSRLKANGKTPKPTDAKIVRRIRKAQAQRERQMDLSTVGSEKKEHQPVKDRVILLVRDAYWLHVHWSFSHRRIARARAAMAEHWHVAKPTVRLLQVKGSNTTKRIVRDIEIHGGVNHWYIDIQESPENYRVEIGYLAPNGKFYALGRSNSVTTPRPGSRRSMDVHWDEVARDSEAIFSRSGGMTDDHAVSELRDIFEERLRRPMGAPMATQYGAGVQRLLNRDKGFELQVDAELIVYGTTNPDAYVTLAGEPVKLREDGSFTIRISMPDRRQMLPVVAQSSDGIEQHTTILSIDRNTKVMEPIIRDAGEPL